MALTVNFLPEHRSILKSVRVMGSWCWPGSALLAYRGWLRRFLLLKLATVLLFPHTAGLPLLAGCVFSLRALLLLRCPHVSTKPSTVLLGRLALTDGLVPLHWMLRLARWAEEAGCGTGEEGPSAWWRGVAGVLGQQLLDAHHLASLLLLGLLGLEATLLSRWPQQTRRFRTSQWAQLGCGLVWAVALLELLLSLHMKLLQDPQTYLSTLQTSQSSSQGLRSPPGPPAGFSSCLRRTLWLLNIWLHYAVLNGRPQKRVSVIQ